jgi:hypothetical protein
MTFVCVERRRQIIFMRFFFFTHLGGSGFRESGFRFPCRGKLSCCKLVRYFFCVGLYPPR